MNMSTESVFQPGRRKTGVARSLPWLVVGAIAVVAVIALGYHFRNTGQSAEAPLSNTPAVDVSKVPHATKLDPAAKLVAARFVQTAVARKNLAAAYRIVGPAIKQGQSLASFKTGNIAVIPYPVDSLDVAPMKIVYSYPKEIGLEIALLPKASSKVQSAIFTCVLIKVRGKWLVNLWSPRATPAVPNASGNVGG